METRKVKEVNIKVIDKDGNEGSIPMTDFGKMLVETIGEDINLTFKSIGKEMESLETSHNNDFKKPCPTCDGKGLGRIDNYSGTLVECPECDGQGFIKS